MPILEGPPDLAPAAPPAGVAPRAAPRTTLDVVTGTSPSATVSADELREFANHVQGQVRLPTIAVDMNPRLGLVAVPTWFWVDRATYAGQDLTASDDLRVTRERCQEVETRDAVSGELLGSRRDCGPPTLDVYHVEVRLSQPAFEWSFGDHVVQSGTLGRAYPERSDVAHVYLNSSLRAGGSYPVGLKVTWQASYRVSGAADLAGPLPATVQAYGPFAHRVQEAQAVLTRP